ncbi:MAG: acyltransferase [Nanoarchaeota archaeon]|nr:acyltransferase [Nanoarchaeota archaeon]
MIQHQEEYKFKSIGKNVTIFPLAKIVNQEVIEIGDDCKIDDFTFINGGKGIKFGKGVHIASFTSIIGGGELIMGDYTAIGCGARLLTGTGTSQGRMSAAVPKEQMDLIIGKIVIEKDAFIGTNCIIHPNVTIGEGAVVGSNSLILNNVEPWTINIGNPCRTIGKRKHIEFND